MSLGDVGGVWPSVDRPSRLTPATHGPIATQGRNDCCHGKPCGKYAALASHAWLCEAPAPPCCFSACSGLGERQIRIQPRGRIPCAPYLSATAGSVAPCVCLGLPVAVCAARLQWPRGGGVLDGRSQRLALRCPRSVPVPSISAGAWDGRMVFFRLASAAGSTEIQETLGAASAPENLLRLSLGEVAFPVDGRHASAPDIPAVMDRSDAADL